MVAEHSFDSLQLNINQWDTMSQRWTAVKLKKIMQKLKFNLLRFRDSFGCFYNVVVLKCGSVNLHFHRRFPIYGCSNNQQDILWNLKK